MSRRLIIMCAMAALAGLVLMLMAGCGGGDESDGNAKTTEPVNCAATPERCK